MWKVGLAVVVPAVVAALIGTFGKRGWAALAVGLGYLAGHLAIARPTIPPADVTDRIPYVALAGLAIVVFEALRKPGAFGRAIGRAVLLAFTLGLMLGPVITAGSLDGSTWIWLAGTVALALTSGINIEALTARPGELKGILAVMITALGAGVVLLLSGSLMLGCLGIALASALAGEWIASRGREPEGFAPVAIGLLAALVIEGYVYADVPVSGGVLLALAPAGAWMTQVGPARQLERWKGAMVGALAVMIPVGIAVGLAVARAVESGY